MVRAARLPITTIAVIGVGLIACAVGIVVVLGVGSAKRNTESLLVGQAQALIESMEATIDGAFEPVIVQGRWIRSLVESGELDLRDVEALDLFMSGALAGTPYVGGIAVVGPDGSSRRWGRTDPSAPIAEDWSANEPIRQWLADGRGRSGDAWQQPFWTPTLDVTVLLHDQPLHRDGEFLGMLGQVVPVAGLSRLLNRGHSEEGMMPFVLYGRDQVLAHPLLADFTGSGETDDSTSLLGLEDLGDGVLRRIWSPDVASPSLLRTLVDMEASVVDLAGNRYLFLYKSVGRYGPQPWIVGAYLDTELYGGREVRRLVLALSGGIAVLVGVVVLATLVGLRVSRSLGALSAAARAVEAGDLDRVRALPGSVVREIDDAARAFGGMVEGLREGALIRSTLGRFLPEQVARTLLDAGGHLEPSETEATLLFCDIEGFTALTESLGPSGIVSVLNAFFSEMVHIIERHGGVVTQFQGDAILATFNVPVAHPDHASNALRAALEMLERARSDGFAGERLAIRIGVNSGPVVAGAVGADQRQSYTVHGDAVNLAARLEALNKELGTRILASEATVAEVTGFDLRPMGEIPVHGQSAPVGVFEVMNAPASRP